MLTTPLPESSTPPGWIQLLPPGPEIIGIDGRRWLNDLPHSVIASSKVPLPIDFEHSTEHRAPRGLEAPAAGWVDRLEVREGGSVWGYAEWTPKATQQIQEREYRYLSPVFTYRKDTGQIVALTSAGLTNRPNLSLKALNIEQTVALSPEERRAAELFGRTEAEALAVKQQLLGHDQNARTATASLSTEERRTCETMAVDPVEFFNRRKEQAA